jgi:hypothetical protein
MSYPPFLPPEDRAERQLQALDEMIQIGLQLARLLPAQAEREAELRAAPAEPPPEPPPAPAALHIAAAEQHDPAPEPEPEPEPGPGPAASARPQARRYAWPSVSLCYARLQHAIAEAIRLQRTIQADRDKAAQALYAARNHRRNELGKTPALRDRYRIFHTLEQEIAAHAAADAVRRRFLLEDLDDHMQHPDFGGQIGALPAADIAARIRHAIGLPRPAPTAQGPPA